MARLRKARFWGGLGLLLTGITLGNTSEALTYNGFGELARQTAKYGPSTSLVDITYDAPGFERDALGRIVRKTEVIGGVTTLPERGTHSCGHCVVADVDLPRRPQSL